jgi:glycosyltransferase involved in cell wall biosynthesis
VALVPNAIDLERSDRLANGADGARLRAALSLGPAEALLVSVGRLEANKGFHVLARALGRIRDLSWRWVLVGDGPYRRRIEIELSDRGVGTRAILTGPFDERQLHAWYEAATLFVHPTLYEGSSLVTLEAMAHRRAVVATRVGGLPDKVRPGSTGWLVAAGDDAEMAAVLREAIAPGSDLTGMGRAGRVLVEGEFSWEKVAGRLVALVGEMVGGQRVDPLATER